MSGQLVGLLLVGFAGAFGLLFAWQFREQRILRRRGVSTTAHVVSTTRKVEVVDESGLTRTRRFSVFEFVDASGTTRRFKRERRFFTGDVVDIRYDPKKPTRVRVTTPRSGRLSRPLSLPAGSMGTRLLSVLRFVMSAFAFLLFSGALVAGVLLVTGLWDL